MIGGNASVALPSERTIVITRVFDAPRAVVFDTWTNADHVRHWWDPSRVPLATCEIDLRVGGAFRFVNAGPHARTFSGTYRAIDRPTRLVFTRHRHRGVSPPARSYSPRTMARRCSR